MGKLFPAPTAEIYKVFQTTCSAIFYCNKVRLYKLSQCLNLQETTALSAKRNVSQKASRFLEPVGHEEVL